MTTAAPESGVLRYPRYDLNDRPFLVIWESTRACELACRHCRAEANPFAHPDQLTTAEARALLDELASLGNPRPLFVVTGGDPLMRHDLLELIAYGTGMSLPVAVSPSATPHLTANTLGKIRNAGSHTISLSLDGATAAAHDSFRGYNGVFARTMALWEEARSQGMRVQLNTTVTRDNVMDLPGILRLAIDLGVTTWSVFFLIQTGRGRGLDPVGARHAEDVMAFLFDCARLLPLKTTEAPQYRRMVLQRTELARSGKDHVEALGLGELYQRLRTAAGMPENPAGNQAGDEASGGEAGGGGDGSVALPAAGIGLPDAPSHRLNKRAPMVINAGKGFVFVSHTGDVQPSGFLPLAGGNVRNGGLLSAYRSHPLFKQLRDPEALKGRCRSCEYREECGGSRSRAYATHGDPLAEDPLCPYIPSGGTALPTY